MEANQKLQLFATQMYLEPAEDVDSRSIPINIRPKNEGLADRAPQEVLPCGQVSSSQNIEAQRDSLGVTEAVMPGGKRIKLLKTLLTSACERNCYYCPFRAGRGYRRATFKPDEMAQTFMNMYRAGLVEGLFLSSGIIKGGVATQDKLIETADILRHKLGFHGYVHLKDRKSVV